MFWYTLIKTSELEELKSKYEYEIRVLKNENKSLYRERRELLLANNK
jgi:hypothetical protein